MWWCWRCWWTSPFPSGAPGACGDSSERQNQKKAFTITGENLLKYQIYPRDWPGPAHRRRSALMVEVCGDGVPDVFFLTLCIYVSWNIFCVCSVKLEGIRMRGFTLMSMQQNLRRYQLNPPVCDTPLAVTLHCTAAPTRLIRGHIPAITQVNQQKGRGATSQSMSCTWSGSTNVPSR